MEFKLNEDQQLMKDMFVEFTEQFVKPIAAELDEQERFPEELIPQLGETGLLGIPVAEEYGGAGADNMSYVLAVEEVSKACASTGVTISAHTSLCCCLRCICNDKQRTWKQRNQCFHRRKRMGRIQLWKS